MATSRNPYAALDKIADPALRQAMKLVIDQIGQVRGNVDALPPPGDFTVVDDPQHPTAPVNLRTLQRYIEAALTGALITPPARPDPAPVIDVAVDPPPPPPPPPPPNPPPPWPPDPPPPHDPPPPVDPPTDPPTGPWLPPQLSTGRIRISGKFFRTPSGAVYRWRGATDFLLFKRYLDGENISPIMADRTGEGATLVRVLGMCVNITDFRPVNYPNYLAQLPSFLDTLAGGGLDCEFVVFADAQGITEVKQATDQRSWFTRIQTAVGGKSNVVLEAVNEGFQNGVTATSTLARPNSGVLSCPDCGAPESYPTPPWDYATLHTPRDGEWPRKSKDVMELADILERPAVADEPMGADEVDMPGKRSNVPNDFFDYAAVGMLLGRTGGTFHSSDGITSAIWRPTTRTCAQSFYAGIAAIPDNVLDGRYTRGPLSDCPLQHDDALALRTFCRYTGNLAVCAVVRPTGAWSAIAQNGWTIVNQTGPNGRIVTLTK